MSSSLPLAVLLTFTTSPAPAQCADGVCLAPSPFTSAAPDARLAQSLAASIVRIINDEGGAQSIGSGTIVDKQGGAALVLTCGHLFREGVGRVTVRAPDGRTYAARVLDVDHAWDMAALMIRAPAAPAIPLAAASPGGNDVLAYCGYGPRGQFASGAGRLIGYVRMQGTPTADTLQLVGAARQGDSGGPIVDSRGQLVGLIVGTNGRIVIGPSCRPIRRFLERFVRPTLPAGNDASLPQNSAPNRTPNDNANASKATSPRPPIQPRVPTLPEVLPDAPATIPAAGAGSAGPTLEILLPLLLAALGISVPPTSVFVGLRVFRCMRRHHLHKLRRRRRSRKGQRTNDEQEPGVCPLPDDKRASGGSPPPWSGTSTTTTRPSSQASSPTAAAVRCRTRRSAASSAARSTAPPPAATPSWPRGPPT